MLVSAFLTGATAASPVALQQPGTYDVQGAYVAASQAADCHPDPRDLAGIQSVESPSAVVDSSGHVSNPDGSPVRGDGGQSYGPFQFYTVAGTWTTYGAGGDPDNLGDAAKATARMLCANNYATDRHAAIARHNGSGPAAQAYADRVIAAADASAPITVAASSGGTADDGCQPTGKRGLGDVLNRAWCGLVVKPWDKIRHNHPSPTFDKVDHAVFGDANETAPARAATGQPASVSSLAGSDGMQPAFVQRLGRLFAAAPGSVAIGDSPGMGFRTVAQQQSIIDAHGGECGVWVACIHDGTCGSMHCKGLAADLTFDSDSTKAWVHDHAADYGLTFPMDYEDWHIEPVGARGTA